MDKALEMARQKQADSTVYYCILACDYYKRKDDLLGWFKLCRKTGDLLRDQSKAYNDAILQYQAAITTAWRNPQNQTEWYSLGGIHLSIGYCLNRLGNIRFARDQYESGRSIWQDTLHREDTVLADVVLRPLGNNYERLRDWESGIFYLQESYRICRKYQAWSKAALAMNDLGVLYLNKENYPFAIRSFQQADSLPGLSPDTRAMIRINLGLALLKNGRTDEALSVTQSAQQLMEDQQASFKGKTYLKRKVDLEDNYGNIYQALKQFDKAASHFQSCVRLNIQVEGTTYFREVAQGYLELCDLYHDAQQPDSTLHYAQIAIHCLLPKTHLEGELANPEAHDLYAEHTLYLAFEQKIIALQELSAKHPNDGALLSALLETCDRLFLTDEILRREYDFEESKLYRQDAVRPYFEAAVSAAFKLQEIEHAPSMTQRAWQYAEQARERRLIESMQERDRELMVNTSNETRTKLTQLSAERTNLQTQIFERELRGETSDSLNSRLYQIHMAWLELLRSAENPEQSHPLELPQTDLATVQAQLGNDEATLDYFCAEQEVYAFVLTNRGIEFLRCPENKNLDEEKSALRKALTEQSLRDAEEDVPLFTRNAGQLFDALLALPLSKLPATVKHIVIIPDTKLYDIPFELLGNSTEVTGFKRFPYLLRRYGVSYAGSCRLWLKQVDGRPVLLPVATVFAGFAPQYSPGDTLNAFASRTRALQARNGEYQDLPESRKEVQEIAGILNGKAYLGREASESNFKQEAPRADILHLAMHTWLEDRDPMFSRLLFTHIPNDASEDNDLNAIELYNMALPARMVVLSACETGLGKVRQGEGVMSLARAFTCAGVPATIMSLWQVEDAATHALMVDFYRKLKTGLSKDDALRQAKLNYLLTCDPLKASPYYWGGFIASGNMSPLFRN